VFNDNGNNRTKNGFGINSDNFGGFNNQNTLGNKRTQQDEINEANESLKSLRLKMNNGNNNLGNNRSNVALSNNATSSNDNYRKPFKPIVGGDFANNNSNLIDINKNGFNNNNNINNLNANKASNFGANQVSRLNNANTNNNKNVSLYNTLILKLIYLSIILYLLIHI